MELTEKDEDVIITLNDKVKLRIQSYFQQIREIENRINQDIFLILESSGYDTDKVKASFNDKGDILVKEN